MTYLLLRWAEAGWLPDWILRAGIRWISGQRLKAAARMTPEALEEQAQQLLAELRSSAVARATQTANEQHYEVTARFFELTLGPALKYSCAYWPEGVESLAAAEKKMLDLYGERAQLKTARRVLDLGCGWGSFSLHFAPQMRDCEFVAVSNSNSQRRFIMDRAEALGLKNLTVVTADVNEFVPSGRFDRIVSIEMFEHVRNYATLLARIERWLLPGGLLFVHIFCHRTLSYPYETEGDENWMAQHFFTEGLMPAADTLLHFQESLRLRRRWLLSGLHYARTAQAWLDNLDAQRGAVREALEPTYGEQSKLWLQRWRLFYLACAEFFALGDGREWGVGHYLFEKPLPERSATELVKRPGG